MEKNKEIIRLLNMAYPDAETELDFHNPYELLVAVILSAQCTDKRVNQVTPALFSRYPDAYALAQAEQSEVERLIHSCGFFRNKATNIIGASQKIISDFGGEVPSTVQDLMTLPGVGKKTANVVYSVAFGGDAIAVDTHVYRVSRRLGLSKGNTPLKVEEDLNRAIPKELWGHAHHLLIFHGRRTCHSRKPDCENCNLKEYCVYYGENNE
ncbi:MAG: endonuclease III [Clostridia bacterium]|nr:endonuclease III [Clostridia bacterium]